MVDADGPVHGGGAHSLLPEDDGMVEDMIAKGEPSLSSNQVVLSAGEDQYQTVTIVPNDSASGEVSYVLIVQQNEEKKDGGEEEDLEGVYDFEGGEDGAYRRCRRRISVVHCRGIRRSLPLEFVLIYLFVAVCHHRDP